MMKRSRAGWRATAPAVVGLVLLGVAPLSCSTGGGGSRGAAGPKLPEGVDSSRALLSLEKIEPALTRPARPEGLAPLSERGAKQIAAARKLIDEQRYTEASLELERALRFDPNHFEIHRALTLLHWQAGNIERAKSHATRAIEGNPDCAAAHYVLGRCAAISGDKAAALTALRTAALCSDIDEDLETATLCRYHLAQALSAEGYYQAALTEYDGFERSAAAVGNASARLELAALLRSTQGKAGEDRSKVLENLGRPGEAADALAPLMAAEPTNVERGKRYARLLSLAGRFDEALTAARQVPADDADFVEFLFDLHQRAGHPERIIDDLRARVTAKPGEPEPLLQLADALVRLERASDARTELQTFLDRNPNARAVRVRLLDSLEAAGEWAVLFAACADGIRKEPDHTAEFEATLLRAAKNAGAAKALVNAAPGDDAVASYLRGIVAGAIGDLDLAAKQLEKSFAADAKFIPGRVALARNYLKAHRYSDALRVGGRVDADRAEDARLEAVLARAHDYLDDSDRAEFHYRAATQMDRGDIESMYALAQLHLRSDQTLRAQQQLKVLLGKDPDHEGARELLAFTYLKENKRDVFSQEITELKKRTKSPTTVARCRSVLEPPLIRDASARRQLLLEAIQEGKADAVTWIAVAESYDDSEAKAKRDAFLRASELDPENEDATWGVIRMTGLLLEFEDAAVRLEKLLPLRPNRHEWRRELAKMYSIGQDYERAIATVSEAAERADLPPKERDAYRSSLVTALADAGRAKEATERVKVWSEAEPDRRELKLTLANMYLRADQPNDAAAIYGELVGKGSAEGAPRNDLIRALAEAKRHDRALQYVLEWLNNDPENDGLLNLFLRLLLNADRFDQALEVAKSRLLRSADREPFQDLVMISLAGNKQHTEAVEWVESLLGELMDVLRMVPQPGAVRRAMDHPTEERLMLRPNEPATIETLRGRMEELRYELARQLVLAERFKEAEQKLNTWLSEEENPQIRARYLFALADCQRWSGREVEAGATLEKLRAILPHNPTLNNDIAYAWIDRGEKLDEAEPLIRYALGRFPQQAAYLDTYGWLLYKRGDFAGAKKWLVRANHARDDGDAVIHDHLGDTLWRLGDKRAAVEHWKTALEKTNARKADEKVNADEQRVRDAAPGKIEDAGAGRAPNIAGLEGEAPESEKKSGS